MTKPQKNQCAQKTSHTTLASYLASRYTPITIKNMHREITRYTNTIPHHKRAKHQDITNYIGQLRGHYKHPRTLNYILLAIKVYYYYLYDTGKRRDNPAATIKLRDNKQEQPQLQDLLTTEELETLMHKKERYAQLTHRNQVITSLFIYQGLHAKEILKLTIQHIDLKQGIIHIHGMSITHHRTLALNAKQIMPFHHYLHITRPLLLAKRQQTAPGAPPADALLLNQQGQPLQLRALRHHIWQLSKTVTKKHLTPTTIRQSVIANKLKQGYDIKLVQAFAGHKKPSTTERYKQSHVEELKAQILNYHPLK